MLLVLGVLLAPLALEQLRETLGLSQDSSFWHFVIFAIMAAMAAYAAFVVGAAYQALLAGVAGDRRVAVSSGTGSPARGERLPLVAVLLGIAYLAAALALRARNRPQGDELVTAAGDRRRILVGFLGVAETSPGGGRDGLLAPGSTHGQRFFWDLVLLLVSLAPWATRRWQGARAGLRGVRRADDVRGARRHRARDLAEGRLPDGSLVGWPLALLLIGGAALAAGGGGGRAELASASLPRLASDRRRTT